MCSDKRRLQVVGAVDWQNIAKSGRKSNLRPSTRIPARLCLGGIRHVGSIHSLTIEGIVVVFPLLLLADVSVFLLHEFHQ
jgi:hypothetical protein